MSLKNFNGKSAMKISLESRRGEILDLINNHPSIRLSDPDELTERLNHTTTISVSCPNCGKEKTMKLPSLIRSKNGSFCTSCRYSTGIVDGSAAQKNGKNAMSKRLNLSPLDKVRSWSKSFPVHSQMLTIRLCKSEVAKLDWSRVSV